MHLIITFAFQIFTSYSAKEKNIGRCIGHVQIILSGLHCIEGDDSKELIMVRMKWCGNIIKQNRGMVRYIME